MREIYLRRQGSSLDLNTHNSINSQSDISIHIEFYCPDPKLNKKNSCKVTLRYNGKRTVRQRDMELQLAYPGTGYKEYIKDLKRWIEKGIEEEFLELVKISDITEQYSFGPMPEVAKDDKYLACCFYDPNTDTIRLYPGNNCLVAYGREGTKDFLQTDDTMEKYLPILEKWTTRVEHSKENKNLFQNSSETIIKEYTAHLISQSIIEQDNSVQFFLTDSYNNSPFK